MTNKTLQGSIELREWRKLFNPEKLKREEAEKINKIFREKAQKKNKEPAFSF
ncbi:hypothetical protein [Photobacterium sp. J15]|uniref:hypothetical protein n=1 Tax=Photobacterium sp. J15 TaxID=265901 RepID=UPI000A983DEB|nr:hypothetical protein [Photobacterium sp. J15]